MPRISLVVCLFRERDLLARLLQECAGLYDDLVVVHDGPEDSNALSSHLNGEIPAPPLDYAAFPLRSERKTLYLEPVAPSRPGSIHELVTSYQGRYFEGPRCFQQEPHWPFAWSQAKHNWILRLDADEFPSEELKDWLRKFRGQAEPSVVTSGYTCIWPLWNGKRAVTQRWPTGRNFLFHRERVRFFGMAEQVPIADFSFEAVPLILHHQPVRKSYGVRNILIRRQGGIWRRVIAQSLLKSPLELPRWRWETVAWPEFWKRLREHPIRYGVYSFARGTLSAIRDLWLSERKLKPLMAAACPLQHLLIGLLYRKISSKRYTGVAGIRPVLPKSCPIECASDAPARRKYNG